MADGEQWREIQLRVHSFIREENTPFWREKHLRIPDHLCGWLKLKKDPEFSSESDAREEEVLAWKHDVSFNRLAIDYCILLYYNCKLKWACFLVFIFYFYSSLIYIYLACESIRFFRSKERKLIRLRFAGFSCNIIEHSKFEISYFKKKTNQRKRFCSRKFKLPVYFPMICFKFSRKIRKLFHKNERFGAILNLHVEWSPLTWLDFQVSWWKYTTGKPSSVHK